MPGVVGVALLKPVPVLGIRSPEEAPIVASPELPTREVGWK